MKSKSLMPYVITALKLIMRLISAKMKKTGEGQIHNKSFANQQRTQDRRNNRPLPEIPTSLTLTGHAHVADGDTVIINDIRVRLLGVNAPELNTQLGQESKRYMAKICKNQTIHAELTGDRSHDRLIGTCYLPDGTDIGAELIKAGLALDYTRFSKGKYQHLEDPALRQKLRPRN